MRSVVLQAPATLSRLITVAYPPRQSGGLSASMPLQNQRSMKEKEKQAIEELPVPSLQSSDSDPTSKAITSAAPASTLAKAFKKSARKVVQEETKAIVLVLDSVGVMFLVAALSPVAENGYSEFCVCVLLFCPPVCTDADLGWSGSVLEQGPTYHAAIYALAGSIFYGCRIWVSFTGYIFYSREPQAQQWILALHDHEVCDLETTDIKAMQ
ncbi:hypothetical protein BT96DRAFT_1009831 [Gymnopus androsaceus JB14]|uniref:Uncharacterized protein n=1 Tax=Gymnopus androsaceus JB14 TaxID=1447944 RepID=A0A6A4GBR0_9AGAR|nr:hypothetical protein BT96DRAFT_1009831 [Gymnopus androsaceus JB14]